MIHGSIFSSVKDKQPAVMPPVSFSELVEVLKEEACEADAAAKTEQTCISPATYPTGATRSKAAALSWDWFAADIDNKAGNVAGSSIDDIIELMSGLNSPWFVYTTTSSRPDSECFRLMFPLDRPILNSEFKSVWLAFSRMLPMDPQTKDISRLFIVPRKWAGRQSRIEFKLDGMPVSVDQVVQQFPARVSIRSPAIASQPAMSITHRTRHIANSVPPSLDAPYVPSKAIDEALSAIQGGRMYRFLVKVAFQALRTGYDISPHDLEEIGNELASMMGRDRADIRRDAESAHRYAANKNIDDRKAQIGRMQAALRPKSLGIH